MTRPKQSKRKAISSKTQSEFSEQVEDAPEDIVSSSIDTSALGAVADPILPNNILQHVHHHVVEDSTLLALIEPSNISPEATAAAAAAAASLQLGMEVDLADVDAAAGIAVVAHVEESADLLLPSELVGLATASLTADAIVAAADVDPETSMVVPLDHESKPMASTTLEAEPSSDMGMTDSSTNPPGKATRSKRKANSTTATTSSVKAKPDTTSTSHNMSVGGSSGGGGGEGPGVGGGSSTASSLSHEQHLAHRREKDRVRYANMTEAQRKNYNAKRREQYHRQTDLSRKKRRDRERLRYHSLADDDAKKRNARRAELERERYKKLDPEALAERNKRRRERAAALRRNKKDGTGEGESSTVSVAQDEKDEALKEHIDSTQDVPMVADSDVIGKGPEEAMSAADVLSMTNAISI